MQKKLSKQNNSGFTLSEVLIAVAILIVLMGLGGSAFTWQLFIGGALLNALPGIALQLVLIPAVMVLLDRTKLVRFYQPAPVAERAV